MDKRLITIEVNFDNIFYTESESLQRIDGILAALVGKICFFNQYRPNLPSGWMKISITKTNTNNDQQWNQIQDLYRNPKSQTHQQYPEVVSSQDDEIQVISNLHSLIHVLISYLIIKQ